MKRLRLDAILFILIISILGIANLLNFDKPEISVLENRALKKKPVFSVEEIFGGSYSRNYEEYFNDTFIFRDNLVKVTHDLEHAMNFLGPDITLITTTEDLQVPEENCSKETPENEDKPAYDPQNDPLPGENTTNSAAPTTSDDPTTTSGPEQSTEPGQQAETDFGDGPNVGYWLVVDGKAVQLFKFNKESFEYYAQVLNKYSEKLGSGVKIYSMIPPTTGEFLTLKKYRGITDSQNDALGFLESKLTESISSINVFDALNKHKDEYIYFKTDHHWTALGAYYAYASFAESVGEVPSALDRYEKVDLGDFLGSSYTKTLDKSLEKNPDNITAYKPYIDYEYTMHYGDKTQTADVLDMKYTDDISKKYLAFMSTGGATWSVIKTDVNNGKKLMVVKDSFGNALVPFLLPHYEEIYVVDPRFYSIKTTGMNIVKFVEQNEINEVLFCIYMEDVNWHKFMNSVENLLDD